MKVHETSPGLIRKVFGLKRESEKLMLSIVPIDHPVLLGKAEPVEFPLVTLAQTYSEMLALMIQQHGIGLAAPQVGLPLRMFVYRLGKEMGIVINPRILTRGGEKIETKEGCLSLPGQTFSVKRSRILGVAFQDMSGKWTSRHLTDLAAIVFQHEIDHLDGVLICQVGQRSP